MKTFVINLAKNVDRMRTTSSQLDLLGIEYERVAAVYGKELTEEQKRNAINRFRWWCAHTMEARDGEIGCALSHYRIYQRMVDENIPYACILEDDNYYCSGFVDVVRHAETSLVPSQPMVILLSNGTNEKLASKRFEIKECKDDSGTYAYIITKAAARNLLLENYPLHVPCDEWRRWVRHGAIKLYHAFPTMVMQINEASECGLVEGEHYHSDVAAGNVLVVSKLSVLQKLIFKAKRALGLSIDRIIPYKGARGNRGYYAYPKLARHGLCNLLFTWANAELYCYQTGAKMIAPQWVSLWKIGPWLRREKYKRYYGGNFTSAGKITGLKKLMLLAFARRHIRIFSGMSGFFEPFMEAQEHIKTALWRMTCANIKAEVEGLDTEPFIAVHIRRGDFKQAGYLVGNEWFVQATRKAISNWTGEGKPLVRVFTDGRDDEVAFLSEALPDVRVEVMDKAPPIRDLLLMSRAKILIGSAESTFSMWAVFLGQMPSYWAHPMTGHMPKLYRLGGAPTIIETMR